MAPRERTFATGLVVTELKSVNLVFGLIPHDKVEIIIGKPTAVQIVRYGPNWLVCEHVRL